MAYPHAVLRVGVRFILPDRNMPFRWNSRMETNATAYGHVLECATKYIKHMLNVIHSWDGILEATWMYRLETLNRASVVVHGHIELNVYRLIQKHYHLDWSSIVKTFNRNFMNKFPFRPVALFVREFGIKCDINGIEATRTPGVVSGAIKKNHLLTPLLALVAMWANVNILE
ncbi:hypothetical protein CRM22_010354 [Opisthorchis felineus]|uniref:Uncharacterized protein n=1 Tax=Opisthorchis felineus TaxID=147828 RepID=A0A4S2KZ16_OPIFE|nr:hypothetical protein CRM22_010354 [Opisthorchis felineus]